MSNDIPRPIWVIPNEALFKTLAIGDSQYEKFMIHVANADRVFAFHLALNIIWY